MPRAYTRTKRVKRKYTYKPGKAVARTPLYTRSNYARTLRSAPRARAMGTRAFARRATPRSYNMYGRAARSVGNIDLSRSRIRAALKMQISPCVSKYLKSLVDPFNGPADACLPFAPPCYSERIRVFSRTTLTMNAYAPAGQPWVGVFIPGPGNTSIYSVFSTNLARTSVNTLSSYMTVNVANNSPLVDSDFYDQMAAAVVSMGVRVKYIGTADNIGGYIGVWEPPAHENLLKTGTWTQDMIRAADGYKVLPVTPEWTTICFSGPRRPEEYNYAHTVNDAVGVDTTIFSGSLFMEVLGANSTYTDSYIVEHFTNFEYVGRKARGTTYSEQDLKTAPNAVNAISDATGGQPLAGDANQMAAYVV